MAAALLAGRKSELAALNEWLGELLEGKPQIIFISGEAGAGKTRLVNEFIEQAREKSPEIVPAIGYCNSHFGHASPLLPFRQISSQLLDDTDETHNDRVRQLKKKITDVIVDIAPDAVGVFIPFAGLGLKIMQVIGKRTSAKSRWKREDPHTRAMIFEQYSRLLFLISEDAPLLLVLEDLHWADGSTLEFLFHLARSWQANRVMIIGTYRPEEVPLDNPRHPLSEIKRELTRYGLCQELSVGWLDADDISHWLSQLFPGNRFGLELSQWIHERTGGNALFINELLHDLQERHIIFQDRSEEWTFSSQLSGPQDLPSSIVAVLEQRIARLETELQNILTAASVEGEEFTAQIVAAVRQLDEDRVIDSLIQILERRSKLVKAGDEKRISHNRWLSLFKFRHALMKEHIYNDLGNPQKRRLHKKVGECLEEFYQESDSLQEIAPALARHFARAREPRKAYRYAMLATEQAEAAYDFKATRDWLDFVQEQLESFDSTPAMHADLWHRIGRVEARVGSFKRAEASLLNSIQQLEAIETNDKKASILADLAYCYLQNARSEEAIKLFRLALHLNRKEERGIESAYNLTDLALAHMKNLREGVAKEYLLQALNQFEELNHPEGFAYATARLGVLYRIEGNFDLSRDCLVKAIGIHRQLGDKFWEASNYTNLGSTYLVLKGNTARAMACYEKSLELSREISKVHEEGHVLLNIARLHALNANWDDAAQIVAEGLRLAKVAQQDSNIIRGLWYRGIIEFYQGDVENAFKSYEQGLAIAGQDSRTLWGMYYNLGSLYKEVGEYDKALKAYRKSGKMLLRIANGMTAEQRNEFFQAEGRVYVFWALRDVARQSGRDSEADSVLEAVPFELAGASTAPRFYWGGGKWI